MLNWFLSIYAGRCSACGKRFPVDTLIALVDGEYVGQECCSGTGYFELTDVMPPRTQASDRCPKCFIIHATAQVECE